MIQNGKNPKSNVLLSKEFIVTPPKRILALSRFRRDFLASFSIRKSENRFFLKIPIYNAHL